MRACMRAYVLACTTSIIIYSIHGICMHLLHTLHTLHVVHHFHALHALAFVDMHIQSSTNEHVYMRAHICTVYICTLTYIVIQSLYVCWCIFTEALRNSRYVYMCILCLHWRQLTTPSWTSFQGDLPCQEASLTTDSYCGRVGLPCCCGMLILPKFGDIEGAMRMVVACTVAVGSTPQLW